MFKSRSSLKTIQVIWTLNVWVVIVDVYTSCTNRYTFICLVSVLAYMFISVSLETCYLKFEKKIFLITKYCNVYSFCNKHTRVLCWNIVSRGRLVMKAGTLQKTKTIGARWGWRYPWRHRESAHWKQRWWMQKKTFWFGETILKHFLDIMEEDEGIEGHFTVALNNVSELC